jgi:hypothetical protein
LAAGDHIVLLNAAVLCRVEQYDHRRDKKSHASTEKRPSKEDSDQHCGGTRAGIGDQLLNFVDVAQKRIIGVEVIVIPGFAI